MIMHKSLIYYLSGNISFTENDVIGKAETGIDRLSTVCEIRKEEGDGKKVVMNNGNISP